jgi:hypothetical protein
MSTHKFIKVISEDECMGDSLEQKINPNFKNLDNGLTTLIQTLTGLNTTSLTTLKTTLESLSSILQ